MAAKKEARQIQSGPFELCTSCPRSKLAFRHQCKQVRQDNQPSKKTLQKLLPKQSSSTIIEMSARVGPEWATWVSNIGWKLMVLVSIVKTGGSGGESRKHQQNKSNFWQSHCGNRNQQCSHDYAILKFLGNSTPCYVEHLLMGAFR